MLKLDNDLLEELGLGGLPEDQKRAMLQHIYDTLELRVGTDLANQMSDRQLEEFEKFIDDERGANQAQALQWLEANLPNYKQVVNDVFEALKLEIRQMAPQIMAASVPIQPAQTFGGQQDQAQQLQQQAALYTGQPLSTQPPQNTPTDQLYQQQQSSRQYASRPPQDATGYRFPAQQPPAGPGTGDYQQPPYSSSGQ